MRGVEFFYVFLKLWTLKKYKKFLLIEREKYFALSYRTRTIIARGLYTFYSIFEGQKRLFKELFS